MVKKGKPLLPARGFPQKANRNSGRFLKDEVGRFPTAFYNRWVLHSDAPTMARVRPTFTPRRSAP